MRHHRPYPGLRPRKHHRRHHDARSVAAVLASLALGLTGLAVDHANAHEPAQHGSHANGTDEHADTTRHADEAVRSHLGTTNVDTEVTKKAAAPVTVKVHLAYHDNAQGADRPVVDLPVEIWTFAPRALFWTWAPARTGRTDMAGNFTTTLPFRNKNVIYAVRYHTRNSGVRCCSGFTLPGQAPGGEVIALGTDVKGGRSIEKKAPAPGATVRFARTFRDGVAAVFNVMDVMYRASQFVRRFETNTTDDRIGRAVFGTDHLSGTWFDPVVGHVNVLPRDRWNDEIILHEYGHYVQYQIGSLAWIASSHDGCTPDSMWVIGGSPVQDWDHVRRQHAWLEGFADWFAAVVLAETPAQFRAGTRSSRLEVASCPEAGPWPDGDRFEDHVAAFLWDMTDGFNGTEGDDRDGGTAQIAAIMNAVDGQLDTPAWPTLQNLTDLYVLDPAGFPQASALQNALRNKVHYIIIN
jgi:hypothetical protein